MPFRSTCDSVLCDSSVDGVCSSDSLTRNRGSFVIVARSELQLFPETEQIIR